MWRSLELHLVAVVVDIVAFIGDGVAAIFGDVVAAEPPVGQMAENFGFMAEPPVGQMAVIFNAVSPVGEMAVIFNAEPPVGQMAVICLARHTGG